MALNNESSLKKYATGSRHPTRANYITMTKYHHHTHAKLISHGTMPPMKKLKQQRLDISSFNL